MAQETIDLIRQAEEKGQEVIEAAKKRAEEIIAESKKLSQEQYDEAIEAAKSAADITYETSRDESMKMLGKEAARSNEECAQLYESVLSVIPDAVDAVIEELLGSREG